MERQQQAAHDEGEQIRHHQAGDQQSAELELRGCAGIPARCHDAADSMISTTSQPSSGTTMHHSAENISSGRFAVGPDRRVQHHAEPIRITRPGERQQAGRGEHRKHAQQREAGR